MSINFNYLGERAINTQPSSIVSELAFWIKFRYGSISYSVQSSCSPRRQVAYCILRTPVHDDFLELGRVLQHSLPFSFVFGIGCQQGIDVYLIYIIKKTNFRKKFICFHKCEVSCRGI